MVQALFTLLFLAALAYPAIRVLTARRYPRTPPAHLDESPHDADPRPR